MLIRNAELYQGGQTQGELSDLYDLRIRDGVIQQIGTLMPIPGEPVIEAGGAALLPGLNDHHIHFLSYAASLNSIDCSPGNVPSAHDLANLLTIQSPAADWLRGVGYHESVAGAIDRHWLDQFCPHRPLRIQHRTGRLWIFNSLGVERLIQSNQNLPTPLPLCRDSVRSGRFLDVTSVISTLVGRSLPPVHQASKNLARLGVTGFADMTPSNDSATFDLFSELARNNTLLQRVHLARNQAFSPPLPAEGGRISAGPVKIHLHETRLPPLEELVARITASHHFGVAVAIHCVTEIEMLFSLQALEEAGPLMGDRIEHASMTPDYLLERIKALGVTVVTQPHFIARKGDTYLQDIDPSEHNHLYRARSFLDLRIPLAASSDAPFGDVDPWAAMRAAISRRTQQNAVLGAGEALSPEQALALFLGALHRPGEARTLIEGAPADLCLLSLPWAAARTRLLQEDVRLVLAHGQTIYEAMGKLASTSSPYSAMASINPQRNAV
ncbi:amidohydrolase family protein [Ketobacter sp.]|uniref:amidohydrolase family protein n=1 Tax=Ketobacter sp. TaxID=2083498 RepID=UPI000F16F52B|nr:amidohydrolase family protein [Ketobacter sp.]RLT98706.1 MAG: hydrolase [Ketobacter sp.]